jgi:hypothetical protein
MPLHRGHQKFSGRLRPPALTTPRWREDAAATGRTRKVGIALTDFEMLQNHQKNYSMQFFSLTSGTLFDVTESNCTKNQVVSYINLEFNFSKEFHT